MTVITDVEQAPALVRPRLVAAPVRSADAVPTKPLRSRLLRFGVTPFFIGSDLMAAMVAAAVTTTSLSFAGLFILSVISVNAIGGLYRSRLTLAVLDDLPSIAGRGVVAGAVTLAAHMLATGAAARPRDLLTSVAFVVLAVAARSLAYAAVYQARRRRYVVHPTIILGAGRVGGQLADTLLEHPEYGLAPVGFCDSDPLLAVHERPVPLLGGHEDLARMITDTGSREVIIAFGAERESEMIDVLRTCDRLKCEIFLVPRLFEMHGSAGQHVDGVWGMPLIRMRRAAYRSASWRLKRLVDIIVSATMLALTAPLLALIALAVRVETGPGVLFRQERVGLDGFRFTVFKFRTLKPVDSEESATLWNVAHDARLGRIGRFLRRSSLDELPQLINVLAGHMSLVGPRPERPHFVDEFQRTHPRYLHRHRVPAGLTGWAQVHGLRGDTSISDRARFDNYYVENWSLWLDAKILMRTAVTFLRGAG